MPIPLMPNETFELPGPFNDAKKQDWKFRFRYLCGREQRVFAPLVDAIDDNDIDSPVNLMFDAVFTAFKFTLVGWSGIVDAEGNEVPFDLDIVEEVMSTREANFLVIKAYFHTPGSDDRKKCVESKD